MSVPTTFLQENLKERGVLADSGVEMRKYENTLNKVKCQLDATR